MNVSPKLVQMLNEQAMREGLNAQRYAKIGAWLLNIGLNNIGKHFFETQVEEEHLHQKLIRDYLTDRNETVLAIAIPEVTETFNSISQLAEFYLATEKETTANLTEIALVAFQEGDLLTYGFMQEMVNRQRDEEDEALTFKDKASLAGDDKKALLLWDANFSL